MQRANTQAKLTEVMNKANIRNRYNQVPELTQDTILESDKYTRKHHIYEDCSNMNASSFIIFVTYMLTQNGIRFYKGLYVTFKLAPDLKKNTEYLSSYSPLIEGYFSILTNSML